MASLTFEWDSASLNPFRSRQIEKAIERTAKKSGGDAIRAARVEAGRIVRGRKRLRVGFVRDALPLSFPGAREPLGSLQWTMRVRGSPVPLIDYPHRPVGARLIGGKGRRERVSGGMLVAVNKGGRMKLIRSAFLATMRNGHRGIFSRGRDGRRLPIHELYSSTVADVFRDRGMVPKVFERASSVYSSSFARLLPLELAK